jgi:hypothetical protein
MSWDNELHNAWISPTGRVFEVYGIGRHNTWAMDHLEKKWLKSGRMKNIWDLNEEMEKEGGWSSYAYEILESWGWIRQMDWGTASGVTFQFDKKPNKRQIKVIADICMELKMDFPTNLS